MIRKGPISNAYNSSFDSRDMILHVQSPKLVSVVLGFIYISESTKCAKKITLIAYLSYMIRLRLNVLFLAHVISSLGGSMRATLPTIMRYTAVMVGCVNLCKGTPTTAPVCADMQRWTLKCLILKATSKPNFYL